MLLALVVILRQNFVDVAVDAKEVDEVAQLVFDFCFVQSHCALD
jgi:hypothetical protein